MSHICINKDKAVKDSGCYWSTYTWHYMFNAHIHKIC